MTDPQAPGTPRPPTTGQDLPPANPQAPPGVPPSPPTAPPTTQPPGGWQAPDPAAGPAPGVEWAGYGERLLGYIVDGLILSVLITGITLLFTPIFVAGIDVSDPQNPTFSAGFFASVALITLIVAVIGVLYFPFFWTRGGQTPGMKLFGIRVVRDQDGGDVTLGAAILRLFGFWISGLVFWLGYIWVLLDKRRRGWFDLIAGTVVIKDPTKRPLARQ